MPAHGRLHVLIPVLISVTVASMAWLQTLAPAVGPTVHVNGDTIGSYVFAPRTVEIDRRKTVHWLWDSNGAHNVTFRKLGKSSITGASETYELRFKRRGTFKYLCTVHGFRGKVVVN
jgi:plastocyanin